MHACICCAHLWGRAVAVAAEISTAQSWLAETCLDIMHVHRIQSRCLCPASHIPIYVPAGYCYTCHVKSISCSTCCTFSVHSGLVASRAQHLAASGNPTPVLPFGVTLLSKAWKDEYLWGHASRFHKASGLGCGPAGHQLQPFQTRQHSEQDLEG